MAGMREEEVQRQLTSPPAAEGRKLFEGESEGAKLEMQFPLSPAAWREGFLAAVCESDGESKGERVATGSSGGGVAGGARRPLQWSGFQGGGFEREQLFAGRLFGAPSPSGLGMGALRGGVLPSCLRETDGRSSTVRVSEEGRVGAEPFDKRNATFGSAGRVHATEGTQRGGVFSVQSRALAVVQEEGGLTAEEANGLGEEEVRSWGDKGWKGECAGLKDTSIDACRGKMSSVLFGYYRDPFLRFFVTANPPHRMQPIMNRGYYTRVEGLRRILERFLLDARDTVSARKAREGKSANKKSLNARDDIPTEAATPLSQVVNFGAGADTTCFVLGRLKRVRVFDVDFEDVCLQKRAIIQRCSDMFQRVASFLLEKLRSCARPWVSPRVLEVETDLRKVPSVENALKAAGLREEVASTQLLRWTAEFVKRAPSACCIYEPFNPHDRFGRVMVNNLQQRGCPLLSIEAYPTLDAQRQRFKAAGWRRSSVVDLLWVYNKFLPPEERLRVQAIEIFDELEEWSLMQTHYFIAVLTQRFGEEGLPRLENVFEDNA